VKGGHVRVMVSHVSVQKRDPAIGADTDNAFG
jgi:hypothetical protein